MNTLSLLSLVLISVAGAAAVAQPAPTPVPQELDLLLPAHRAGRIALDSEGTRWLMLPSWGTLVPLMPILATDAPCVEPDPDAVWWIFRDPTGAATLALGDEGEAAASVWDPEAACLRPFWTMAPSQASCEPLADLRWTSDAAEGVPATARADVSAQWPGDEQLILERQRFAILAGDEVVFEVGFPPSGEMLQHDSLYVVEPDSSVEHELLISRCEGALWVEVTMDADTEEGGGLTATLEVDEALWLDSALTVVARERAVLSDREVACGDCCDTSREDEEVDEGWQVLSTETLRFASTRWSEQVDHTVCLECDDDDEAGEWNSEVGGWHSQQTEARWQWWFGELDLGGAEQESGDSY